MKLALSVAALAVLAAVTAAQTTSCENDCSGHGDCIGTQCSCEEGWKGSDCSTYDCTAFANEGCSGKGQCRSGTCICHEGYGGHNCAAKTNNCPDHCKGHGMCLDGVCTCDKGYKGADCGLVDGAYSCPNNCSGHGFCDTFSDTPTCFCMPDYWSGPACNIETSRCPVELNNCTGHGICGPTDPLSDSSPWVCSCEDGFCGAACNRACPKCLNNCTGHGICVGSVCQCNKGFTGPDCTIVAPIDECPMNCSGHGRCSELAPDQYGCVCDDGYEGVACVLVENNCPANCSGKGECMPDGSCACVPGYNGTACQKALGTCMASNNCSANGVCNDGTCKCFPGFGGVDCSLACHTGGIADIGCNADKGHGTCVNGTCVCKQGEWMGEGCEIPAHETTLGAVTSSNNPLGVIGLSIAGAGSVLVMAGYAYNYNQKGKRGLNAVPGVDTLRSKLLRDESVQ